MSTQSPYASPGAELNLPGEAKYCIDKVVCTQKLMILNIPAHFSVMAIRMSPGLVGVVLLTAAVMRCLGSFRLCSSAGFPSLVRVTPSPLLRLVSLRVVLVLNRKAWARPHAARSRVGLPGATC